MADVQDALELSASWSKLQEAARQVEEEEKEDGTDGLFIAAEQIALEKGLPSPSRRKMQQQQFSNSPRASETPRAVVTVGPDGSTPIIKSKTQPVEIASDVNELFNDMKFTPSETAPAQLEINHDDVNKLLKMAGHSIDEESPRPKPSTANSIDFNARAKKSPNKRYLDSLSRRNSSNKSITSRRSTLTNTSRTSATSQPSLVAKLLAQADSKDFGDRIKQSFRSEMQEMLFRTMQEVRLPNSARSSFESKSSHKSEDDRRKSVEKLSKPNAKQYNKIDYKMDPTLRYLTYDEAKECTFKPLTHRNKKKDKKGDDNEERKEDPRFSFISRQEAEERNRREELNHNIGKKAYDALLPSSKKQCPQCHATQSYDEVKEKRKFCPNCNLEYIKTHSWGKVSSKFFKKCKEYAEMKEYHTEELLKKLQEEREFIIRRVLDKKTGKMIEIKERRTMKMTKDEQDAFLERLLEYKLEHDEALEKIKQEVMSKYTFTPHLKQEKLQNKKTDDDEDDHHLEEDEEIEDDPVRAFLLRYEEDLADRFKNMPYRYLSSERRKELEQERTAQAKTFHF